MLAVGLFVTSCAAGKNVGSTAHQTLSPEKAHPILKLTFITDKDFDKRRIYGMFHHDDPAGLESRARSMGIDPGLARTMGAADDIAEIEKELDELVDARFEQVGERIATAQKEYTEAWAPIIELFSKVTTEVTGHGWFYDEYICVVSAFHPGLSDWYGNKIAAGCDLMPVLKKRIVAHEILLSHLFHITRKYYGKQEVDDWRVWVFSEITAVFVLDDERLREQWPGMPAGGSYFANSNYPQLASVEKDLKKMFDARKSFKDYIDSSVVILKRFQDTHR